jgi:UPF0755 protein
MGSAGEICDHAHACCFGEKAVSSANQPPDGDGRPPPTPPQLRARPQPPQNNQQRPNPAAASAQRPPQPVPDRAVPRTALPPIRPPAAAPTAPARAPGAPPNPPPGAPPNPPPGVSARPAARNGQAAAPQPAKPTPPAPPPAPIAPRSPRAQLQPEDVPAPPRRSRRARNPFVIAANALLTVIFLIAVAGGIAFVIGKQHFELPGPLAEDKVVNIPRGGIRDTADLLVRNGVIDQPSLFVAGALMMKAQNELKYGEYRFTKRASLRDVVETIIEGKVVQHAFTIAEGLTSDQIVQRLDENETLTGEIRSPPREGTLLPETYRFTFGTTREQLIQRMRQAQQRAIQEIWERRSPDLPIKTPEQLITLASIVEKETGKPEERTRVAAVFVNRLRSKMKLQSDPTIIYGLVGGKGSLGRPIQRNEIDQPTAYNTYVIDGLPPGPIANPGRASLEAAANPARTKELYFVADGTGGHAFADNYEQHQKNVARLRALEQQSGQPAANAAPAPARPRR